MSDTHTTQPTTADAREAVGHGRHRGQISTKDAETAPQGRHRKQAAQAEATAAA
ncbi:hypothetical protein SGFS_081490 [Streptomyces graminofaciens]|uniref:Uncharacterized protein n=1 Tax=Streptomyces graminofaciens TaxID=68212 RepID=A0ABM8HLW4_9ACTN|nr:hypothetical protein [Streptomyces graminofaciens]BBC36855.1 hypothetical protein SGFS_081490 [Streptomyces graminofaciens]